MTVEEYVREDGTCPFRGWFNDLDVQAAAKVATAIVRMELGNLSNVKWIGAAGSVNTASIGVRDTGST